MAPWPPLAHAFLLPRVRATLLHVGTKVHKSQRGPHVPAGWHSYDPAAAPQQPIPMADGRLMPINPARPVLLLFLSHFIWLPACYGRANSMLKMVGHLTTV